MCFTVIKMSVDVFLCTPLFLHLRTCRYKKLDAITSTVPIGLFLQYMKKEQKCGKQRHNTSKHCCLPLPYVMFERYMTTSGEADLLCVMWVTELMEQRAWLIKPVHPLSISL